eukprot:TRINITY_DN10192_c0_g1_i1.p1 TRINITY_DN10192_c0_g1~~TRINITY_DN10192_c0_g1_i1.p1  ORF type:complete len:295 (-),score=46.15 TRINITY_DN10192_c0_g1_i1:160-1044(-)
MEPPVQYQQLTLQQQPKTNKLKRCLNWFASWEKGTWIRVGVVFILLCTFIVLLSVPATRRALTDLFIKFLSWIDRHKLIGSFAFMGLYMAATVFLIPGSILTLGGGFVFGLPLGVLLVWIGASFGATLAFLLGRSLLRNWVQKKIEGNEVFASIDRAIEKKGWQIVLLLRLAPLIPFNLLNYALALTRVKTWQYIVFTCIGMIPGTLMYVYFGSLAKNIADLAGGQTPGAVKIAIWVVSGVVIIIVAVILAVIARRAIKQTIINNESSDDSVELHSPPLKRSDDAPLGECSNEE